MALVPGWNLFWYANLLLAFPVGWDMSLLFKRWHISHGRLVGLFLNLVKVHRLVTVLKVIVYFIRRNFNWGQVWIFDFLSRIRYIDLRNFLQLLLLLLPMIRKICGIGDFLWLRLRHKRHIHHKRCCLGRGNVIVVVYIYYSRSDDIVSYLVGHLGLFSLILATRLITQNNLPYAGCYGSLTAFPSICGPRSRSTLLDIKLILHFFFRGRFFSIDPLYAFVQHSR